MALGQNNWSHGPEVIDGKALAYYFQVISPNVASSSLANVAIIIILSLYHLPILPLLPLYHLPMLPSLFFANIAYIAVSRDIIVHINFCHVDIDRHWPAGCSQYQWICPSSGQSNKRTLNIHAKLSTIGHQYVISNQWLSLKWRRKKLQMRIKQKHGYWN